MVLRRGSQGNPGGKTDGWTISEEDTHKASRRARRGPIIDPIDSGPKNTSP